MVGETHIQLLVGTRVMTNTMIILQLIGDINFLIISIGYIPLILGLVGIYIYMAYHTNYSWYSWFLTIVGYI